MKKPNRLKEYFKDFFLLFFPETCFACTIVLFKGEHYLCLDCLEHLPKTKFHTSENHALAKLFWGRLQLESVNALYYYQKDSKVQHLIHQLKYKRQPNLGIFLGSTYAKEIKPYLEQLKIDAIIPVPLHKKRLKKRGYNQSLMIAKGISKEIQTPIFEHILLKQDNQESQTKKNKFQRWVNVSESYLMKDTDELVGKHILLVDDVITTGSTLESCASILIKKGKCKVSLLSIAFSEF